MKLHIKLHIKLHREPHDQLDQIESDQIWSEPLVLDQIWSGNYIQNYISNYISNAWSNLMIKSQIKSQNHHFPYTYSALAPPSDWSIKHQSSDSICHCLVDHSPIWSIQIDHLSDLIRLYIKTDRTNLVGVIKDTPATVPKCRAMLWASSRCADPTQCPPHMVYGYIVIPGGQCGQCIGIW